MFRWLGLLFAVIHLSVSQNIRVVNNSYEGILLAIADGVPYNPDLLTEIQVCTQSHSLFTGRPTTRMFIDFYHK